MTQTVRPSISSAENDQQYGDQPHFHLQAYKSTSRQTLIQADEFASIDAGNQCIHQWFEAQVEKTPNAIALSFNGQHLTYQTLNRRANQLAHYLLHQGLQPQELVVISTHRSLEMVIGFLGVLKAGGAYVPIDPAYPDQRRAYQLQDTQARLILTQQHLVNSLPQHAATVICLDSDWQTISSFSSANPTVPTTPDQLAYVIYTSGSTGLPKGVMIPHRGVVNHSRAITQTFEMTSSDCVLQFSSISFDTTVEQLYPALVSGARVVLRTEEAVSSTHHFLRFIQQHHITVLILPVAFWHEWVNGLALLQASVPSSVRLVAVGGEKPSRSVYAQWCKRVGHYPRWLNGYGPTETTVTTTFYDPIAANYDPTQGEIPIGNPITNAEVYILNSELEPVPLGECGELHIGGPGLARGYLNLPEQTSAKFIQNPFSDDPQSRLYKTGDMVRRLLDGNLEFVGRIDFQVKLRGFRVELSEIEVHLEQYAPIQQAIVLVREDAAGDSRLVAYLKLHPNQSIDLNDLRIFLQHKLPDYMIPVVFVELETFPITPNGKVDRQALPAPSLEEMPKHRAIVAPGSAIEAKLVQIWEAILGVSGIGITDNFFELGGHSLLVARLSDQIFQEFGANLPLSILLQAPTIAQLATLLTQPRPVDALVLIRAGGTKPPIFFIHDGDGETLLYRTLAYQLDPERPIYGIQPRSSADHPILHTRIEQMAAYYLEQIRAVQAEGPYYLSGLCAGGVLAYEIACQLQQQGQKVAMVALLDAVEPSLDRSEWVNTQRLNRLSAVMSQKTPINLLSLFRKLAVVGNKAWNALHYEASSLIQRNVDAAKLHTFRYCLDHQWTPPRFLNNLSVRKAYLFAEGEYAPTVVFDGQMLLLRATQGEGEDQPYQEIYPDAALGWGKRAKGVSVYDVPGGHSSMLQMPNVQVTAEIIQSYLDRVIA